MNKLAVGPLSVIVDGSLWFPYASGVFNGCAANPDYNHAAVLVGVDLAGNWKMRNSWGVDWGEKGYIRVTRALDCGLTSYALVPNFL